MKKQLCLLMLGLCISTTWAQEQSTVQRNGNVRRGAERTSESRRGADKEAQSKVAAARLRFDHTTYNFGDVQRKGGNLTHDFKVINDGTTPLVVTRVVISCSCLKASFPKRPIAPGASEVIRITYEPLKSDPGTFNKVIQVYSNSVDGRSMLTVQGNSLDPNKK